MALYAMEGNAQDTSGKNNHGTVNGLAAYDNGYAGQALIFNGTNTYVDLPIGTLMTSLADTTIATHVYFNGVAGTWQRIFDFGSGTTNYMFLTPRLDAAGPMRFAIRTATVGEQVVESPASMSVGWHHVAVVIDSKTMTLTAVPRRRAGGLGRHDAAAQGSRQHDPELAGQVPVGGGRLLRRHARRVPDLQPRSVRRRGALPRRRSIRIIRDRAGSIRDPLDPT